MRRFLNFLLLLLGVFCLIKSHNCSPSNTQLLHRVQRVLEIADITEKKTATPSPEENDLDSLLEKLLEHDLITTEASVDTQTEYFEPETDATPDINRPTRRPTRVRVTRPNLLARLTAPTRFSKPSATAFTLPARKMTPTDAPISVRAVNRFELVLQRIRDIQDDIKKQQSAESKAASDDTIDQPVPSSAAVILASISNLQNSLRNMINELKATCISNNNQIQRDPIYPTSTQNPYAQLVQNVTALQNEAAQQVLNYWTSQLPPAPGIPGVSRLRGGPADVTGSVKLPALRGAVVKVLEDLMPKLAFIESFNGETARKEDWTAFTEAIKYVREKIKNNTVAQVLGPEKVRTTLMFYDKYLESVDAEKV